MNSASAVAPICRTTPLEDNRLLACAVASNLSQPVRCRRQICWQCNHTRNSASRFAIKASGAWSNPGQYFVDVGLVAALSRVFGKDGSVAEFGAGVGCYTASLRAAGIHIAGFDGMPEVAVRTGGLVEHADLTEVLYARRERRIPVADWVLALEVAEHVPRNHEKTLLANLHAHNRRGVVISWATSDRGVGHVNPRSNEHAQRMMRQLGYQFDAPLSAELRASVRRIIWYRDSLMAFRRTDEASRVDLNALWTSWAWERSWRPGFCSATSTDGGDCDTGSSGSWKVVRASARGTHNASGAHVSRMHQCVEMCKRSCARCRFVSYSDTHRDCDWFHECDLSSLHMTLPHTRYSVDHLTLEVDRPLLASQKLINHG